MSRSPLTAQYSVPSTQYSALSTQYSQLDTILLGSAAAVVGALTVGIGDHYYFNIEYPHMVALMWLCIAMALAARRLLMIGQPAREEK